MISGTWIERFPFPVVSAAIRVEGITVDWVLVPFVVDTGATHTSIHARDAIRLLRIPPEALDPTSWPVSAISTGVGGTASYLIRPAEFMFAHDDATDGVELIQSDVQLGALDDPTASLPSLLGWDVLQHFDVRLRGRLSVSLERLSSRPTSP